MRRLLAAALLLGCNASLAQVSTMGTTAMGLPSTPAAIVTSPLNGPSPFSATTQPGVPDTTLAPVPLASDPTIPGTVLTCATPTGQITPGTPTVTVFSPTPSMSAMGTAIGTMPPISAAPTTSALPPIPIAPLTWSQQPETSATTVAPRTAIPIQQQPTLPALPSPSVALVPVPVPSMGPSVGYTPLTGSTGTMPPSTPLGTITPILGSATGTISPLAPLGSSSTIVCSSTPGGPPTNSAALPLSTPAIPASPPLGTIQPDVAQLGDTSINPTMAVMPTPNTSACAESTTMTLATPGMMAPANATGAAATPGVSPPGC